MSLYLISYDLIKEKDYNRLNVAIVSIARKFYKPLFSAWVIETDMSALELTNALLQHTDFDDKLFVSMIDRNNVAWARLDEDASSWLKENL